MFRKWIEETPDGFDKNEIVSVRQWLAILLVTITPVLNIVMLLCWALRSKEELPASLVNWARAVLILILILTGAVALGIFLVELVRRLGHGG